VPHLLHLVPVSLVHTVLGRTEDQIEGEMQEPLPHAPPTAAATPAVAIKCPRNPLPNTVFDNDIN